MTANTSASSLPATGGTSTQGLAGWAAPYITDYLGKTQALANTDYQTYQGPLTAGASPLQTNAFSGIGSLTVPGSVNYTPVGGSFTDAGVAGQYMNPYLMAALNPTLDEMRRQSQITQMENAARMTQAGSYGGARQAILDSEGQRNLLRQLTKTVGEGYATAYDKAMGQYNTETERNIGERKTAADYGLKSLDAKKGIFDQMLKAGEIERGIDSEGIKADYDEFNRQREFPYKQLQFMRDMISGLPTGSVTNSPTQLSGIASLISAVGGVDKLLQATGAGSLADLLKNLGLNFGDTEPV